jgi:hypothetical protein
MQFRTKADTKEPILGQQKLAQAPTFLETTDKEGETSIA